MIAVEGFYSPVGFRVGVAGPEALRWIDDCGERGGDYNAFYGGCGGLNSFQDTGCADDSFELVKRTSNSGEYSWSIPGSKRSFLTSVMLKWKGLAV